MVCTSFLVLNFRIRWQLKIKKLLFCRFARRSTSTEGRNTYLWQAFHGKQKGGRAKLNQRESDGKRFQEDNNYSESGCWRRRTVAKDSSFPEKCSVRRHGKSRGRVACEPAGGLGKGCFPGGSKRSHGEKGKKSALHCRDRNSSLCTKLPWY